MTGSKLFTTAIALVTTAILSPAPAAAGSPATIGAVTLSQSDIVRVHDDGYRHHRRRHHKRHVIVDAPTTYVETYNRRVWVDAPFAAVRVHPRGVWVRAPFVNLYVPR
jgi:hypothetical protein